MITAIIEPNLSHVLIVNAFVILSKYNIIYHKLTLNKKLISRNNILDKMEDIGTAEGLEECTKTILSVLKNSTNSLLIRADQYWPLVAIGIEVFNKQMFDLKRRNVNCRFITEVTRENLVFCKELIKIGDVRHLHGLKATLQ